MAKNYRNVLETGKRQEFSTDNTESDAEPKLIYIKVCPRFHAERNDASKRRYVSIY